MMIQYITDIHVTYACYTHIYTHAILKRNEYVMHSESKHNFLQLISPFHPKQQSLAHYES